ncbi:MULTISPECIES: hypothetical protein [Pseudomonas]|uniref:Uncharacterized protein n=1 Tax=Pseudomonas brassicacearum TaxID=930166 RepID=A0AAJ3KVR9_9PSED|nr:MULTISPECIES: hypothetical protein [Pseudomonas]NUT81708.1 hypothetical protein [Pseudomonas brassicacearum]QGA50539.1 hypothetical protein GFU70_15830 [Pseudomonas brassicacearum]
MSLQLASTDEELKKLITRMESDALVTPAEFREIREKADIEVDSVTDESFRQGIEAFQAATDMVAERLQELALAARQAKLGVRDNKNPQANVEKERMKRSLKYAIEFQLAYIVLAYKSSLERL